MIGSTPALDPAARPPSGVDGWAALFEPAQLPVLDETAAAIEAWRANEDAADAHSLAEVVAPDPLMTLKLLAHVAGLARRRRGADDDNLGSAETVTAALVLLGIGPFFRAFEAPPTVGASLSPDAAVRAGFDAVLQRSRRAAAFAMGFAAHRMDPDAAVIHEAALLHDFAELLLWLRAPALALRIAAMQAADPSLRSARAQREVLGIELPDLQQHLMRAWRLPPLLVRITDDRHADDAQVRNVVLAIRVARHSAQGWDNPALPDDVDAIGALLQLAPAHARRLLLDIDAAV